MGALPFSVFAPRRRPSAMLRSPTRARAFQLVKLHQSHLSCSGSFFKERQVKGLRGQRVFPGLRVTSADRAVDAEAPAGLISLLYPFIMKEPPWTSSCNWEQYEVRRELTLSLWTSQTLATATLEHEYC